MTRPPAIAHSLHAVVALLESVNGQIGAISTDTRTNTQQLATISENQARAHDSTTARSQPAAGSDYRATD
jgi:negative regulator of sigma E activity